MKKLYIIVTVLVLASCATQVKAISVENTRVVIAAIQTSGMGAPGDDFVVLHNGADNEIDITGWKVQYRAASATGTTGWTTKRTIACDDPAPDCHVTIAGHGNIVVASYAVPDVPVQKMTSGFSSAGGQIRLMQPTADKTLITVDMVGYGTAVEFEGAPAIAPQTGQSLVRKVDDTTPIDTQNNRADFEVGCLTLSITSLPVSTSCVLSQSSEDNQTETPVAQGSEDASPSPNYAPLLITELLPDPASPALDSKDEFIELYNPNSQAIHLAGYTLQAGKDFNDKFTFSDAMIPAGGYYAIFSDQSHIGLTNTGTAVRLLDPLGSVQDTVLSYGQAKTGQSWTKSESGWQWSTEPTPGGQNVIAIPSSAAASVAGVVATKKPSVAATKKVAATAAKAPKATVASKTATTKAPKTAVSSQNTPPQGSGTNAVPYMLLGVAGAGILGYAGYEYRQEIGQFAGRAWRLVARRKEGPAEATLQTD